MRKTKTVYETCTPRQSVISGDMNPQMFTASLERVMEHYRTGGEPVSFYEDADTFFREINYPSDGMSRIMHGVFGRLSGDMSAPAVYRLSSAFGGGKTHTMIACVHVAEKGLDIAEALDGLLEPDLLPVPGEITVAGVSCVRLDPSRMLWDELAEQITGEPVETPHATAPGFDFLDWLFEGRTTLVVLDELAQYMSRLDPMNSDQVPAFLMALCEYARENPGLVIIASVASLDDAFAESTKSLVSVLGRDTIAVVPVEHDEKYRIMVRWLFEKVDREAAIQTVDEYTDMYHKWSMELPDRAGSGWYRRDMIDAYPFHPSLISWVQQLLSDGENSGRTDTRGILRMLALIVRNLWRNPDRRPMCTIIQVPDTDMADRSIEDTVMTGRESKIWSTRDEVEADLCEGGNADIIDRKRPHPDGVRLYHDTWLCVFLSALASPDGNTPECELDLRCSTPKACPIEVMTARSEIRDESYSMTPLGIKGCPTLDNWVAITRPKISQKDVARCVRLIVDSAFRDVRRLDKVIFPSCPSDIPDDWHKLTVAVLNPLETEPVNLQQLLFYRDESGAVRKAQNSLVFLVPNTVQTEFGNRSVSPVHIERLARQVCALKILKADDEVIQAAEQDLMDDLAACCCWLYYPTGKGLQEIRLCTEGGFMPSDRMVMNALAEADKLIDPDRIQMNTSTVIELKRIFIHGADEECRSVKNIISDFTSDVSSPMVAEPQIDIPQILKTGCDAGVWVLYNTKTDEFFTKDNPVNIYDNFRHMKVMTYEEARRMGLDSDVQDIKPVSWFGNIRKGKQVEVLHGLLEFDGTIDALKISGLHLPDGGDINIWIDYATGKSTEHIKYLIDSWLLLLMEGGRMEADNMYVMVSRDTGTNEFVKFLNSAERK